jgi:hypothetical protein
LDALSFSSPLLKFLSFSFRLPHHHIKSFNFIKSLIVSCFQGKNSSNTSFKPHQSLHHGSACRDRRKCQVPSYHHGAYRVAQARLRRRRRSSRDQQCHECASSSARHEVPKLMLAIVSADSKPSLRKPASASSTTRSFQPMVLLWPRRRQEPRRPLHQLERRERWTMPREREVKELEGQMRLEVRVEQLKSNR